MLIERNAFVREMTSEIVKQCGCTVIEAHYKEDIVQKLENTVMDLIIVHLEPHYKEIIDVLRMVRNNGVCPCIPILVFSSEPMIRMILNQKELYGCHCIQMPFSPRYLMSVAFMCMNHKEAYSIEREM